MSWGRAGAAVGLGVLAGAGVVALLAGPSGAAQQAVAQRAVAPPQLPDLLERADRYFEARNQLLVMPGGARGPEQVPLESAFATSYAQQADALQATRVRLAQFEQYSDSRTAVRLLDVDVDGDLVRATVHELTEMDLHGVDVVTAYACEYAMTWQRDAAGTWRLSGAELLGEGEPPPTVAR